MNPSPEQKFIAALEICQSLAALQYQKTLITFDAIKLLCEVARDPANFWALRHQYATEVAAALRAVEAYATQGYFILKMVLRVSSPNWQSRSA